MITKELKGTKAITLIAMVISILVLLILAGVSLALVVGENGITQRAVTAKKTYDIAGAKEKLELDVSNYATEFYQAKYTNGGSEASGTIGSYKNMEIKIADFRIPKICYFQPFGAP